MKKFLFLAAACFPLLAAAQFPGPFTVKSKIGKLNPPAKAYLVYQLGANNTLDSAAINNGDFVFKGDIINPTPAILVIDHKGVGFSKLDNSADVLRFFIEKGEITINSADSASKAQITGSPINDDNKKLMVITNSTNAKIKKLMAEAQAVPADKQGTTDYQNSLQTKYKAIQQAQKDELKAFILKNPNSYLSLLAVGTVGGPAPDPAEIDPLYNALSQDLKNTEGGRVLKQRIDDLRTTAIGALAPDFVQNDVNGKPIKLSSFRGKYVLLDFWASWCGPCRQENPNVVKVYNKYKSKNFTVVGVSLDKPTGKVAWINAIKDDKLDWTQVSDLKFWNNGVAALYSVRSIPQNFLIDPTGKIVAKDLRGEDLENKLAELLGKM